MISVVFIQQTTPVVASRDNPFDLAASKPVIFVTNQGLPEPRGSAGPPPSRHRGCFRALLHFSGLQPRQAFFHRGRTQDLNHTPKTSPRGCGEAADPFPDPQGH